MGNSETVLTVLAGIFLPPLLPLMSTALPPLVPLQAPFGVGCFTQFRHPVVLIQEPDGLPFTF
jgi:hypothetical protein